MPHMPYHHPSDILRHAAKLAQDGVPLALVIITDVTGGAMRGRGALICVTQDAAIGYVSNGCVDADIIFQARRLLSQGGVCKNLQLRYGEGSLFKDITLPCGGRIDVRVTANIDALNLAEISQALDGRRAVDFHVDDFTCRYTPPLRLRIIGRGEAVIALARQASSAGFSVILQSPDKDMATPQMDDLNLLRFDHLTDPSTPPPTNDDAWTAVIVMFHDHDWEPHILAQACRGPAFYIGAMGSPRTHEQRKIALETQGVSHANIDRIHGPIGLIPAMRDANLLALSALAQIVDEARKAGLL